MKCDFSVVGKGPNSGTRMPSVKSHLQLLPTIQPWPSYLAYFVFYFVTRTVEIITT